MKTTHITIFIILLLGSFSCDSKQSTVEKAKDLNREGLDYFEKGDYKEARRLFFEAAEQPKLPDTTRAIYFENVADAYARDTLYDSARTMYTTAAKLYPHPAPKYYINMAYAYFQYSHIDSALAMLEAGFRADSNNAVINNLLGLVYLGEYDKKHFDPEKAYNYNRKARKLYLDAPTKLVLAKNEYHINNTWRSLALFRQLHLEYPSEKAYLIPLILIKAELEDSTDMNLLKTELKKNFPDDYNNTINDMSPGQHTLSWTQ